MNVIVPRLPQGKFNLADPLSEPTVGRRCLAALFAKGFTKSKIAQELGTAWSTPNNWEKGGEVKPENLRRVASLTSFTVDQLLNGRVVNARILNAEEQTAALRQCKASPDERSAFGEHMMNAGQGMHQDVTEVYVRTFVQAYRDGLISGLRRDEAIDGAWRDAVNATVDETMRLQGRAVAKPPSDRPKRRASGH